MPSCCRSEAAQQAAASAHWARHTGKRSLLLWLYYTRQVRLLGVDLPSDSTAPSSLTGSPAHAQAPPCKLGLDQAQVQCQQAQAVSTGFQAEEQTSYRQLTAGSGAGRRPRYSGGVQSEMASQPLMQQQDEYHQDTDEPASPDLQPVKHKRSAKSLFSAGLVTLSEVFSGPLSPPKAETAASSVPASPMACDLQQLPAAAARKRLSLGGHEQQLHEKTATSTGHRVYSASMVVGDTSAVALERPTGFAAHLHGRTAGPSIPRSWGGAAAARSISEAGVYHGALSVPLALQTSFAQAARSQRLRQRWLLVKALNR